AITGAPAATPAASARPAPETPSRSEPTPPAAVPAGEIVDGDVVYGGDGRSYRVLDASHPNRLIVVREEDGKQIFVPRAAIRKEPPPPVVARRTGSATVPAVPPAEIAASEPLRVEPAAEPPGAPSMPDVSDL